jgi:uncharacterized protein YndB with AHSA1/START domain
MTTIERIDRTIDIDAPPGLVWRALTDPVQMKRWMAEPEMDLEILTDWAVGSPIVVRGFHHVKFENTGSVLRFEPERALTYTHLSSLSQLPDTPESHSVLAFTLMSSERGTSLTLTIRDFPTHTIFKHIDFYWRTTLGVLKQFIEDSTSFH